MRTAALAVLIGFLSMVSASAGTLTITASGFATTSAGAPPGWPAGVTWPGSQSANGSKSYTVSDADWASLMAWTAATQFTPSVTNPPTPTAGAILLAWVQVWINGTRNAVAQYYTTPPTVPPPITIQ